MAASRRGGCAIVVVVANIRLMKERIYLGLYRMCVESMALRLNT